MKSAVFCVAIIMAVAGLANSLGTKFERCASSLSVLNSDRHELCFKTVLDEIQVRVGPDGTDDDVTIEVCSDKNAKECCTTPPLKSAFSDDWSKNDLEKWGPRYFGTCKNKVFTVKRGLLVTLAKSDDDTLVVNNITLDTRSADKSNKETERFLCGPYRLGGALNPERKKTQLCKPGPYRFMRIFNAAVKIGADGTDNDVKVKVCSDANEVCCQVKLSHSFSDDWKRNKLETWPKNQFDDCGEILYKVTTAPRIEVTKNGKDDLTVDNFEMQFDIIDTVPKRVKYSCGGFTLAGDCKNSSLCKKTLFACSRSNVPVIQSTTTTRRPTTTTKSSGGLSGLLSKLG